MTSAFTFTLVCAALTAFASQSAYAQPAPSSGQLTNGKSSSCALPNGQTINAPEASGTSQQYYSYYSSYSWSSYSSFYSSFYYGRKLLQATSAPASSSIVKCCPTTTAKQGDTATSLISDAGLPEASKVFFYTLNPQITNSTDIIPAGTTVTVPCFRITEYYRLLATSQGPAQAPARASTG